MEFKKGKGNAANSSNWIVCYNNNPNKYTASVSFGGYMGRSFYLYEITKEIYDAVGTFENDDYKSETLIKTGRLLYKSSYDKLGGPCLDVLDPKYKSICSWVFNDSNNEFLHDTILNHIENSQDKKISELAETMFNAFNDSFDPKLIENWQKTYTIKYYQRQSNEGGYFALIKNYDNPKTRTVVLTDERLNEFIPLIFFKINQLEIKCEDITTNKNVLSVLKQKYGTENLHVKGYEFHPCFRECLICSEYKNGYWSPDAYYNFDWKGKLKLVKIKK